MHFSGKMQNKTCEQYGELNCDGAFRELDRSGGWGFVIQNDDGVLISSGHGRLGKVLEPMHAEVVACLQAVQRAAELGIQIIVLETDATVVVLAVNLVLIQARRNFLFSA
jgi:ribonuclease HI